MSQNRRQFLAGMGASILAAPFLQLLSPGRARAAEGPAKRLLLFFSPNGTIHHLWRPTGSERNFEFSAGTFLEPLNRHKSDLIVIEGLNFLTGNNHEGGMKAMLTNGEAPNSETLGMSLDQFVASNIGQEDRFSSLEYGILTDIWGSSTQTRMSYQGPGQLITPDASPLLAYNRMFGDLAGDAIRLAQLRRRRMSILDIAKTELDDLHSRLGARERLKLDEHLSSVRRVENSLTTNLSCNIPTAPANLNKNNSALVPDITRAQMDLAVLALSCGMTKVASVQLSHTVSPVVFSWVGNTEGHHSLSHASDSDTAGLAQYIAAEQWVSEQFAYLIDQLKAAPDPEVGGQSSLFDNTLVLWVKEMGDSRMHVCESVPFVIAGSAGGAFETGRYLQYQGESHSRLLVSVCQALGLENQTFGDPNTGTGPLNGLA